MSKLSEKSKFNLEAAEVLIDRALFAPSVHCSYYSFLQLLKFKINDFFGVDYEQLNTDISNSTKGSHSYMIDYVHRGMKGNLSDDLVREFKNRSKDLKQFRNESDYEEIEVGHTQSKKAQEIATYLTKFLQQNL